MRSFLVVMLLAGCTNPDEILPVSGLVVSEDPVEGQRVRLLRQVHHFDPPNYTQCQSAGAPPFKETQTDVAGKYSFDVFRVEAQSLSGFDTYCFRIDATFPSGSLASTDLAGIYFETAVGTLRDWHSATRLEGEVIHFEPPIPLPEEFLPVFTEGNRPAQWPTQLDHRAQVVTADGGVVWQVDDRFFSTDGGLNYREPMTLEAIQLEDFTGTLVMHASVREQDEKAYGVVGTTSPPAVELISGERVAVSGSRPPVSRGLPCPELATPCPLTDGDLASIDGEFRQAVSLDLATPVALSAVVLRGVETGRTPIGVLLTQEDGGMVPPAFEVPSSSIFESSTSVPIRMLPDGGIVQGSPRYVIIPLDAGVRIQRVTLQFPGGLSRIQEVSLVAY